MRKEIIYLAAVLWILNFYFSQTALAADSNINVSLQVNTPIVCGNNVMQTGEECDGPQGAPSGYYCTNECVLALTPVVNINSVILPPPQPTAVHEITPEPLVDIIAPANVSDFTATIEGGAIRLNWTNPAERDFRAVKIMRSEEFYPQGFRDGASAYNDEGQTFLDQDVKAGVRYYYTAFAYDNNANYSSGSIASAMVLKPGQLPPGERPGEPPAKPGEPEILPAPPLAPPQERFSIALSDFEFYAANQTVKLAPANGNINLLPGTIINIATEQAKYPKVLKSIILTISSPAGQAVAGAKSYLLRTDEGKKYQSAKIAAPLKVQDYDLRLYFLNYQNAQVAKAAGKLKINKFGKITAIFAPAKAAWARAEKTGAPEAANLGAEITLYNFQGQRLKKWPGQLYSQYNPLFSNQRGQYGFLAPNGTYLLEVKKDNFYKYTSLPFRVENNLVNQDLELIYRPAFNQKNILLISSAAAIVYLIIRKIIIKILKKYLNFATK